MPYHPHLALVQPSELLSLALALLLALNLALNLALALALALTWALVQPGDLLVAQQENPPQHELRHVGGVLNGVRQRQGAPPAPAKHLAWVCVWVGGEGGRHGGMGEGERYQGEMSGRGAWVRERPRGSGAWVRERGEGGAAPKHLEHLPVHEGALREVQVKLALHMTRQPGGGRGAR